MKAFLSTQVFKNLNVVFGIGEGATSQDDKIFVTYGERTICQIQVNCPGETGHASVMFDNSADDKLRVIIDRFLDFKASEKAKLKDTKVKLGDVTSVNMTVIKGGAQPNVVPPELSAIFDIRITPGVNHEEFEKMMKKWCKEAGSGVHYTVITKDPPVENTKLDNSNPFWIAFKKACNDFHVELKPQIEPGATDSRYLQAIGIPTLGFFPLTNTPALIHSNNEHLNKDVFLRGINIFVEILRAVANV